MKHVNANFQKRSELRKLILGWVTINLTLFAGLIVATLIFFFGIYEIIRVMFDENPSFKSIVPLIVGVGLQTAIVVIFVGVRSSFERRCRQLFEVENDRSDGIESVSVLRRQVNGNDDRLAAVKARQSQQFFKRLRALIEVAWPSTPP